MDHKWSDEAAGVRLTAPAVPKVEIRSLIADAIRAAIPELEAQRADRAADSVAEALTAPAVQEELALAFVRALQRASIAYMQRDDIYELPGNLETAARVAIDALSEQLGYLPVEAADIDPEEAERTLADVSYPGMVFEFINAPFPRVAAKGIFPDTDDPEEDFPVNQYAVVRGNLVEAAFAAAMNVLEHEARETFTYRGVRVFNAHGDPGETSGPILKEGAQADPRRSYVADIGPSAGVRRKRSAS